MCQRQQASTRCGLQNDVGGGLHTDHYDREGGEQGAVVNGGVGGGKDANAHYKVVGRDLVGCQRRRDRRRGRRRERRLAPVVSAVWAVAPAVRAVANRCR